MRDLTAAGVAIDATAAQMGRTMEIDDIRDLLVTQPRAPALG